MVDIKSILLSLNVTSRQQTDLCCNALLALANIKENDAWNDAKNEWIRIHDIIVFFKDNYNIIYAENSRETIRKQAIHHFRNAAFIEDNNLATNSPNYRYRLTDEMLNLLKSFHKASWEDEVQSFLNKHESLIDLYSSKKDFTKIPVLINDEKNDELQKAIIEQFAPRFAPNSECLYVGDTIQKDLLKDEVKLKELGFKITLQDKMPDAILYVKDKNWIYFIESVTSVGPMDPKRIVELNEMTKNVCSGKIFVTAFLDFKTFKKFSESLAWDTEVWIAEMPDHMIHLNGDRFLGPRD